MFWSENAEIHAKYTPISWTSLFTVHINTGTGIHLDLVRAPEQLDMVLDSLPDKCFVSLGLVDGRNIWLTPLQRCNDLGQMVLKRLGPERVLVGTSCSLLHVPHSLETEKLHPKKDTQLVDAGTVLHWLSFGLLWTFLKPIYNVFTRIFPHCRKINVWLCIALSFLPFVGQC